MLDAVDGAGSMGAREAVVGGVAFGRTGCVGQGTPAHRFGLAMGEVGADEWPGDEAEALGPGCGHVDAEGEDEAVSGGAFNLFDVYQVIASHEGERRDAIARRGVEIALTKMLGRIEREGRWAVRFADAEGVRRYARRVLATSRRDAARRVAVERRYGRGVGAASARLECAMGGDREAVSASERAEIDEWMTARIGADDVEILVAVALDERSYPELAEEWGVREGTLRTRFHRARTRFTRPWSGEFGSVRAGRERAARQSKTPEAAGYGM